MGKNARKNKILKYIGNNLQYLFDLKQLTISKKILRIYLGFQNGLYNW